MDVWLFIAAVVKLTLYWSLLGASGLALFSGVFLKACPSLQRWVRQRILIAAVVGILSVTGSFFVTVGQLADDGILGLFDAEMIALIWSTDSGTAALTGTFGLIVLGFCQLTGQFRLAGFAGLLLVLWSMTMTGHVSQGDAAIGSLALGVHLLMVSFWFGALMPLRHAAKGALSVDETRVLSEQFGTLAQFAVGFLALAAGFLVYILIPKLSLLWESVYGWLIVSKLLIFALLLVLASVNKFYLVPAMRNGDATSAQRFSQVVLIEYGCFLLIFLLTALLTTVYPPDWL